MESSFLNNENSVVWFLKLAFNEFILQFTQSSIQLKGFKKNPKEF